MRFGPSIARAGTVGGKSTRGKRFPPGAAIGRVEHHGRFAPGFRDRSG